MTTITQQHLDNSLDDFKNHIGNETIYKVFMSWLNSSRLVLPMHQEYIKETGNPLLGFGYELSQDKLNDPVAKEEIDEIADNFIAWNWIKFKEDPTYSQFINQAMTTTTLTSPNQTSLSMSKESFGHYVVYGNKLLFVRDQGDPVEIAEYNSQHEAIEQCRHHNNYLTGVGYGYEIINYID
jgi:hypothetical protein